MPRHINAFFLLALGIHILFFSLIGIRPSVSAFSSIPEKVELTKVIELPQIAESPASKKKDASQPEDVNPPQNKPEKKKASEPIEVVQAEPLIVIPIIVDEKTRWIIELTDPNEEEPEKTIFVSERPSRVNEEMQATRTSENPKPSVKRKKNKVKKKKRSVKKQPRKRKVVKLVKPESKPRRRTKPKSVTKPRRRTQPKPKTATKPKRRTRPKSKPATKPRRRTQPKPAAIPPTTAPLKTETAGEIPKTVTPVPGKSAVAPASPGDGEIIRREPFSKKKNLFPTLDELARNIPAPGGPGGHSGSNTPGMNEGGIGEMPIAPSAPENFLPMIKKRGDITLLNAKSYKFAGFVRRVAKRIFDRFVVGFEPRRFRGLDYHGMKKGTMYEAVMNRSGRTLNIKRIRSSGSENFDSLSRSAMQNGAWDTNVPDGAECADGFVHFIFIPKVIPTQAVTAPNGSRVYSKFLLLAIAGLKNCD